MGLSASQARFLQLTARRNDYEYQAQQINHMRATVADKMQDISMLYSDGMNNRQLCFVTPGENGTSTQSVRLTYNTITAEYPQGLGYKLVDKFGTQVRPNDDSANAIREKAIADYDAAKAEKSFRVAVDGTDGNQVNVDITGDNYMVFVGNAGKVLNKNGQEVNQETFKQNIKGMSAVDFNKYWNQMGYSLSSNSVEMTEYQDADKLAQAEEVYNKAMLQADELENQSCIYDDRCKNSEYLESQLRTGAWTLLKPLDSVDKFGNVEYEEINFSQVGNITDTLYTEDDASIAAEYDTQMDYFQHKDKELELQLKQIETKHDAVQTEMESVQKVIEKNVEKSFKTFG